MSNSPLFFLLLAAASAAAPASAAASGASGASGALFPSTSVFSPNLNNITCFRIPSVVQTSDGVLVALAEARRGSCSDGDSHEIAQRLSVDGGATWGDLTIAAGNESYWVGNPTVVARADGSLLLMMALHGPGCTGNCVTGNAVVTSTDGGVSWSDATDITAMMGEAAKARLGPGAALLLSSGRILAPASTGTYTADYVLISDDNGSTWRPAANGSATAAWPGMDEAQLTTLADGSTLLLMRHTAEAYLGKGAAFSSDDGETWSAVSFPWGMPLTCPDCPSSLPSPVCQSSVTTFGGVSYYSGANSTSHNRERLVIRRSHDSAVTWDDGLLIDPGFSAYSCLVSAQLSRATTCQNASSVSGSGDDACGGVLYEAADGVLNFVRFPLA